MNGATLEWFGERQNTYCLRLGARDEQTVPMAKQVSNFRVWDFPSGTRVPRGGDSEAKVHDRGLRPRQSHSAAQCVYRHAINHCGTEN